jgi:hypothetical protein
MLCAQGEKVCAQDRKAGDRGSGTLRAKPDASRARKKGSRAGKRALRPGPPSVARKARNFARKQKSFAGKEKGFAVGDQGSAGKENRVARAAQLLAITARGTNAAPSFLLRTRPDKCNKRRAKAHAGADEMDDIHRPDAGEARATDHAEKAQQAEGEENEGDPEGLEARAHG